MSKVQEAGLIGALGEAEALARVLRAMSDGRLDLQPVVRSQPGGKVAVQLSWEAAKTEARAVAGTLGKRAELTRVQETFCSVCGCLDEPGVHTQRDCPRYDHPAGSTEDRLEAIEMALATIRGLLEAPRREEAAERWAWAHRLDPGPASWHNSGDCQRCGDRHTSGEAEQLNAKLTTDRAPTSPTDPRSI